MPVPHYLSKLADNVSENKKENTREQSELLDKVRETLKNVEDNGFEHI